MIYEYKCLTCDDITTKSRCMDDRNLDCNCQSCGGDTKRKITGGIGFTPILGAADSPGYMCPVTTQWVDSKIKRRRIMDEHNLVEAGDTKRAHS